MHDTDPSERRLLTTGDEDDRDQAAIFRDILFIYPEPITLEELILKMTVTSTEFGERDRVERAVRDLIAAGLLYRREDDLLLPTRTAVTSYRLFNL
jgi:hypothetical protein